MGVSEREPRERVLLGEMGGGASTQAGTLGVPAPRLCPKREPLACVTRTTPRAPGRSCPGAFGSRGRLDRAGSPGDGSGARSAHLSRPPRSSRCLGALQPPPGRSEGGQGGKQHNRGGSSAPVSCRDPRGFLRPRDNGREGEKRVKKLG